MTRATGVISPGGIGFDINCGMRLVRTYLTWAEVRSRLRKLVDRLFEARPRGRGPRGAVWADPASEFAELWKGRPLVPGARLRAEPDDLEHTEEGGCMGGADASRVSREAIARGHDQVGTLGSGNHYLEIQVARRENVIDRNAPAAMGIDQPEQVVADAPLRQPRLRPPGGDRLPQERFLKVMGAKYGISVSDRELACAPFDSPEGQDYFARDEMRGEPRLCQPPGDPPRIREVFSDLFHKSPRTSASSASTT